MWNILDKAVMPVAGKYILLVDIIILVMVKKKEIEKNSQIHICVASYLLVRELSKGLKKLKSCL